MGHKKRIGILTGGGDVPGLNSVIKSLVYGSTAQEGFEVLGIRRGWEGLTHPQFDNDEGFGDVNYHQPLDRVNTRSIDRTGGTYLHTSRTNPSRMRFDRLPGHVQKRAKGILRTDDHVDLTPIVLENLQRLRIDHLVTIGGDDTLSYASVLDRAGVSVVAVPKTMDNDVRNTEYCIGFSTAMTRAVESITRLRTTLGSHERIGVFRVFGRDAGFTALYTAYVTSIRCCIPEARFDIEPLVNLLVNDKRNNPSGYAVVLLSEGAWWTKELMQEYGSPDAFGHRKKTNIAESFAYELENISGEQTTVVDLSYELRSGDPDFLDRTVATTFATMAFECIAAGQGGRMMAIRNGCYTDTEIPDPAMGPRQVDVETMYDSERYRPNYQSKRGLSIFMMKEPSL